MIIAVDSLFIHALIHVDSLFPVWQGLFNCCSSTRTSVITPQDVCHSIAVYDFCFSLYIIYFQCYRPLATVVVVD